MMLMVRLTETTGVYNWLAIRAGQLSRGRPLAVVISLTTTTAVLSAFLDNLTTTATLIGDPPNIIIAGATDLSFTDFIVNLTPIAVVGRHGLQHGTDDVRDA